MIRAPVWGLESRAGDIINPLRPVANAAGMLAAASVPVENAPKADFWSGRQRVGQTIHFDREKDKMPLTNPGTC